MQKITCITMIIALSILILTSCNQANNQSDGSSGSILNVFSNSKDDLIGDFAIEEGGRAEIKISKENGDYFVSVRQGRGWEKPEQLGDVQDKDFMQLFGENWKSYVKSGLYKDDFGIFKVDKGYQYKGHTFKTGYFVMFLGGGDVYKINNSDRYNQENTTEVTHNENSSIEIHQFTAKDAEYVSDEEIEANEKRNETLNLPFIGKRMFNFVGGNGTSEIIIIREDGYTTIKSVGEFGEFVEYEGKYKKVFEIDAGDVSTIYYKINGNTISVVDVNGKIQTGCKYERVPCTSELYKLK